MGVTSDVLTPAGRKFLAQMQALKTNPVVKAGILGKDFSKPKKVPDGEKPGPESLGEVAVKNEYGIGVPERSFIRSTADEKHDEWTAYAAVLQKKILDGMPFDRAMGLMGLRMQADIQAKIRSNIGPPNSPATIERKLGRAGLTGKRLEKARAAAAAGQGTLRDTGQMLNAIAWELLTNRSRK